MRFIDDSIMENADKSQQPPIQQGPDYSVGSNDFFQTIKNTLGVSENAGRYNTNPNVAGAMGKYQFIPARLQELGYDWVDQNNFTPQLQEEVMGKHLQDLLDYSKGHGFINESTTPQEAAGLLWAGHLGGKGGINDVASGQVGASDAFGTSTSSYFRKGNRKFQQAMLAKSLSDVDLGTQGGGTATLYQNSGNLNPPTSAKEMYNLALESTFLGQTRAGLKEAQEQALLSTIDQIQTSTGVDVKGLMNKYQADQKQNWGQYLEQRVTSPVGAVDQRSATIAESFNAALSTIQAQNPNAQLPVTSYHDVLQMAGKAVNEKTAQFEQTSESSTWSQWIAGLAGTFVGFMKDPLNVASMAGAAAASPLGLGVVPLLQRAGIAGVSEVPAQVGVQREREAVGLPSGVSEAAVNIAGVAIGSAVLDGAAQGIIRGSKALWNKGSSGITEFANTIKNDTAGDLTAPIESRVQDMIGRQFEEAGDVYRHAPLGDTPQGRYHLETALDQADKLAVQEKPMFVLPENAPTYYKPPTPATRQVIDQALSAFAPEERGVLKAELDSWDRWQQQAATGTEEQALTSPIKAQEGTSLKDIVSQKVNRDSDLELATTQAKSYPKQIETNFDQTIGSYREGLDENEFFKALELERLRATEATVIGAPPSALPAASRISSLATQLEGLQKSHTELVGTSNIMKQASEEFKLRVNTLSEENLVLKSQALDTDSYKIQLEN